jgi:hypothetical protein
MAKPFYSYLCPKELWLFKMLNMKSILRNKMQPDQFYKDCYDMFRIKIVKNNEEIKYKKENNINYSSDMDDLVLNKTMLELIKNVHMKKIVKKGSFEYEEIFDDFIKFLKEKHPNELIELQKQEEIVAKQNDTRKTKHNIEKSMVNFTDIIPEYLKEIYQDDNA